MFNNRVTENNVETAVCKLAKVRGIAHSWVYIVETTGFRREIDRNNAHILPPAPPSLLPEQISSAHVEHRERPRESRGERLKQFKPAIAEPVRKRVCILVVSEATDQLHRKLHGFAKSSKVPSGEFTSGFKLVLCSRVSVVLNSARTRNSHREGRGKKSSLPLAG